MSDGSDELEHNDVLCNRLKGGGFAVQRTLRSGRCT